MALIYAAIYAKMAASLRSLLGPACMSGILDWRTNSVDTKTNWGHWALAVADFFNGRCNGRL